MIAFKVCINGKPVVTAGQPDWLVLAMHIDALRQKNRDDYTLRFGVGGLSLENEEKFQEHFRWASRDLNIGDSVTVEIVDSEEVDPPKKRYRSDHQVQEDPFTEEEARELRYQDYLELKKEFDSESS